MTNPERLARARSYVYDRIKTRKLKPKIAKIFRFDDVVEAYQYMESNEQLGKIVLTVGEVILGLVDRSADGRKE